MDFLYVDFCDTMSFEYRGGKMKKNIFRYLYQRWRKIVTVIIIVLVCCLVICSFIFNGVTGLKEVFTDKNILENVNYTMQILASMIVIIGGIVGVWQYSLTSRAERMKMSTDCIQRAIDLAEYYKNNILEKYVVVLHVYDASGLINIVKKINRNSIVNFDKKELYELLTEADIGEIEKIRNSDEFIKAVIEADNIYNLNFQMGKNVQIKEDKEKKEVAIIYNKSIVIQKFMGNIVTDILNNLEFFAMHFSHGTADESVVYQSLHQTYLQIVYMLYYNIAILNDMEASRYYTNVIELYKNWDERDRTEKNSKSTVVRECMSKGSIAQRL